MSSSTSKEIPGALQGAYRLTDLEISFVSACAQGANPGAKVIIKKEKVEMPDRTQFSKEAGGKDPKAVNINLDVDGLSKSISDNLKTALTELLAKSKDVSADVLAETVVAVVAGDITKMQKDLNDKLTKAISDLQEDLDQKARGKRKKPGEDDMDDDEDDMGKSDETMELNGTTFRKSQVGDQAFAAIKASAAQTAALRKEMEHSKMVARVEKEFPNIAGAPDDKAALLALIEKSDGKVKEIGLQVMKALNEGAEGFKKEYGATHKGDMSTPDSPESLVSDTEASMKLDKMAKEMAQKDGISVAQAYAKVMETPEGSKLYEEHLNGK